MATLFSTTFTFTDGDLPTRDASWDDTVFGDSWEVDTNRASQGTTGRRRIVTDITGADGTDVTAEAEVDLNGHTGGTNRCGLVFDCTDSSNFLWLEVRGNGDSYLYETVSGSDSLLTSDTSSIVTVAAGDIIKIQRTASAIIFSIDQGSGFTEIINYTGSWTPAAASQWGLNSRELSSGQCYFNSFTVSDPTSGSVDFTGNAGSGAATATGAAPTVSADAQADAGTGGVTATGQAPGVGTDTVVFALGGQSNGVPRVNFDSGTDYPTDGTVKQVGRSGGSQTSNTDGVVINAVRPLDANSQPTAGGFSFHLQFALDYLAANPGHTIVFVPCNDGGTGFVNNRWNPGDALYEDMLSRFNAVLTANPSYVAGGLLWHQGEKDAEQNATGPTYEANLDAMIADFRTETGEANLPVVVSRPYDDYTTGTASAIKAVLADTPNRLTYTAFADPTGLSTSDGTHGNAAAVRTLGSRFYTAYVAAQANTTLGATVSPGTGAATATGQAPTVSAGAQADAGTGGATATGSAPTVSTGSGANVAPGAGAVAADGLAPTVSAGADATASAGAGASTATGSAPMVSADASAAAGVGSVTAEGQAAAIAELLPRDPALIFDSPAVRRVSFTDAAVRRVDLT